MSWKIVTDSGCDWRQVPNLAQETTFVNVPMTLQIGEQVFVDDAQLDIDQMLETMYASTEAAVSACPSPEAFKQAYEGADHVIAITITGALSGSRNSAQVAKTMLLEENPQAKVHVIDSLSAGGEIDLLVLELNRLIAQGLTFEEVVDRITAYQAKTKLVFVLAKVDNLVKNGRLSKLVGKVVGLLNMRMVGEADSEGKLGLLQKPRGQKKAVAAAYQEMTKAGYAGGRVVITHCHNEKICQQLKETIHAQFPQAEFISLPASGLCSFYGEEGGILMGYEIS